MFTLLAEYKYSKIRFCNVKGNGKFILEQTMKAQRGSKSIAAYFL